jgi:hypothetical protein
VCQAASQSRLRASDFSPGMTEHLPNSVPVCSLMRHAECFVMTLWPHGASFLSQRAGQRMRFCGLGIKTKWASRPLKTRRALKRDQCIALWAVSSLKSGRVDHSVSARAILGPPGPPRGRRRFRKAANQAGTRDVSAAARVLRRRRPVNLDQHRILSISADHINRRVGARATAT